MIVQKKASRGSVKMRLYSCTNLALASSNCTQHNSYSNHCYLLGQ